MISWWIAGFLAALYVGLDWKNTPSYERTGNRAGLICLMLFCFVLGYLSFAFVATYLVLCWLEEVEWFQRLMTWLKGK